MIQETIVDSDPAGPANAPFECERRVKFAHDAPNGVWQILLFFESRGDFKVYTVLCVVCGLNHSFVC